MSSEYQTTEEEEILAIDHELSQIEAKIVKLKDRKEILTNRKNKLNDSILRRKSEKLASKDWSKGTFSWTNKVNDTLKQTFKINEFRPLQLETINATLSKQDVILIMPTGGGKSLCYQLPALVDQGITLVVSPLIALMEDQMMGLKKLGIPAAMMSANSSKDENKAVLAALQDPKAKIKLIYVTPEKLAKSKRFMSLLQKCAEQGRFARLAIDEVHCCSTWGHDFRPDYNFLGVFRGMFPDTPILGLTATSTSKVTVDVQKMLMIQGCLVLKASFNRPNLFYQVVQKPSTQEECFNLLEDWLTHKFHKKTGIIYTTTIKECEELTKELRKRGIKAGIYHAMLEAETRSKMYTKWMEGEYQVIIGTIAFGLGIDKPDVRFVIHHCLSKSMESFYQESGRAGRDGKHSDCIVLFKLQDVFKLSTMVFTQQTGLPCLYNIIKYCLDANTCRRNMIAQHFDEVWSSEQCNEMCDHCKEPRDVKVIQIGSYCREIYKILDKAVQEDTAKLTYQKLIDAWFNKGNVKLRHNQVKAPSISRTTGELVIGTLLIEGFLKEDFHFTPYSTISYLRKGTRAAALNDPQYSIQMKLPGAKLLNSPTKNQDKKQSSSSVSSNSSEQISNSKSQNSFNTSDDIIPKKSESAKKSKFETAVSDCFSKEASSSKNHEEVTISDSDSEDDIDNFIKHHLDVVLSDDSDSSCPKKAKLS